MASAAAGSPRGAPVAQADTLTPDVPSTSHFVAVIDRRGQAVTMTSTVESSFGSGLMVGGYFLNNELTDFSLVPEIVMANQSPIASRPGKRPRSAMSPTLVFAPEWQAAHGHRRRGRSDHPGAGGEDDHRRD